MFHDAVSGVEKKHADQHRPEAHEVGTESRRDGHVDAEDDQNRGDQHAANSGESRGFFDVAGATPENRAQHATAIEWITGKKIEDREQQIAGAKQ